MFKQFLDKIKAVLAGLKDKLVAFLKSFIKTGASTTPQVQSEPVQATPVPSDFGPRAGSVPNTPTDPSILLSSGANPNAAQILNDRAAGNGDTPWVPQEPTK